MTPKLLVFYSYRGGVGRTLALCNVAARLAESGDRVVVVDMDFEAPGATVLLGEGRAAERPGLLEYIDEFRQTQTAPDLTRYLHTVSPGGAALRMLPAGRMDAEYPRRLASLDLASDFLPSGPGEHIFRTLRETLLALDPLPHYVLIDSRPGMSLAGAVSVQLFADEIVLLCGLNRQSLAGLRWVTGQLQQRDPEKTHIHYVASPAPPRDGYEQEYGEARQILGSALTAQLPFDQDLLWRERLLISPEDRRRPLGQAYDGLTEALRSPDDIHALLRRAQEVLSAPGQSPPVAEAVLRRALQRDPRDIRVRKALAHFYLVAREPDLARDQAEAGLKLSPQDRDLWSVIDELYQAATPEDEKLAEIYRRYAQAPRDEATRLSWFSRSLRQALEQDEGAVNEVLRALKATIHHREDWRAYASRIPIPAGQPDKARGAVLLWKYRCDRHGLSRLRESLELSHRALFKDVPGVVRNFGGRGFGFLSTDDGLTGVYFERTSCLGYGRGLGEYIALGESAVFDIVLSKDPAHPWRAQNVRFPERPESEATGGSEEQPPSEAEDAQPPEP